MHRAILPLYRLPMHSFISFVPPDPLFFDPLFFAARGEASPP